MLATASARKGADNMEKTLERTASAGKTRLLVTAALFAALGCVSTTVIKVPSPTGGYMNLGDTAVLLGAYFLGPAYGALAGGTGPALADLLGGYPMYVPGTLVIKAVTAVTAGLLYRLLRRRGTPGVIACGAAGEAVMVLGYWLYDALLVSSGGTAFKTALAGAAAGIPSNLAQAGFGAAASTLLLAALRRSGYVRREFPNL